MGRGKEERIKDREGGKGINLGRGEGDKDRGKGQEDKSRGGGKGLRIGEGTRWWSLFFPLTVELEKLLAKCT